MQRRFDLHALDIPPAIKPPIKLQATIPAIKTSPRRHLSRRGRTKWQYALIRQLEYEQLQLVVWIDVFMLLAGRVPTLKILF